jgi:hypothetical protein
MTAKKSLKSKLRRLQHISFSVLVAVVMAVAVLPVQAFADDCSPLGECGEGTIGEQRLRIVQMYPNFIAEWQQVEGADHYNVYRGTELMQSGTETSFTDTTSPDGQYWFFFSIIYADGTESSPVSIQVKVDRTPPTINATVSPQPNSDGWIAASRVRVIFECSDASGIQQCDPSLTTFTTSGANQTVTGTAVDTVGNTSTKTVTINLDRTLPVVDSMAWSKDTIRETESATLTVNASDTYSGVSGGEYFIGNEDPGIGQATPLQMVDGKPTLSLSGLEPGSYTYWIRIRDLAGNWTQAASATLTVLPQISAPNLTSAARQPNDTVLLNWEPTENADHYNIYRDGVQIGTTQDTSFTAPALPDGTYYYYITGASADETYVSAPSNTIDVQIFTPPVTNVTTGGSRFLFPSSSNGDVLPGLGATNLNAATYSFNVSRAAGGVTSGSFTMSFNGGPVYCVILPMLPNCHQFSLSATGFSGMTFTGDNYSAGTFTGVANVKVDGLTTVNPFRVEGLDGNRIDTSTQDRVTIKVFAPGSNPDTDNPLYQVTATVGRSNVTVQ